MIGRNVAIDNSFFLQFTNSTASTFQVNLFNLGGGNGLLTPFVYGTLSSAFSQTIIDLVNSTFAANGSIRIYDSANVLISSQAVAIGSPLAAYLLAVNNITDSLGNTGTLYIQPTPNGANDEYDFAVAGVVVNSIEFIFSSTYSVTMGQHVTNYVRTNPFITAQSTIPIDEITKSQIGYAYRVITIDIYSTFANQILEPITHGAKDANGNDFDTILAPTIDPYQDNGVSIHGLESINFLIDSNTTFSYSILSGATVRITFNYVPITISDLRERETALNQRIALEYFQEKKILNLTSRMQYLLLQ